MKAKEMADIEDCRKVMEKLYKGVPFTAACFQYRVTPQSFWKRVHSNRDLRRELAAACITQAWDRSDKASAEDDRHLATFVKISRDMAASLSPEDWGERVNEGQAPVLVINTNLSFDGQAVSGGTLLDAQQEVRLTLPSPKTEEEKTE